MFSTDKINKVFTVEKMNSLHVRTVINRFGQEEPVQFDRITNRIRQLSNGLKVEPSDVAQKVIKVMEDKMPVSKLDELAASTAASMVTQHYHYLELSGRILASNLMKETPARFSEAMEMVHHKTTVLPTVLSDKDEFFSAKFMSIVRKFKNQLDSAIISDNDYNFDYFGLNTMMDSYLNRVPVGDSDKIIERPQYMFMRVAVCIHSMDDGSNDEQLLQDILETYRLLSGKLYTHATPTLYNAGKPQPQMSSCFLLSMKEDSIEGIYETLSRCALISKNAGGIGLSISNVRGAKSLITKTNGRSVGLLPMLKVFEATARYVDQGGGKRKGSFAMYLEPWHCDIMEFLDLRKSRGPESLRVRDLFYALWVPDLFMERIRDDKMWSLFSSDTAPGLDDVWGDEFNKLYEEYEEKKMYRQQLKARDLWKCIIETQIETGQPYMLYKDTANRKSNQKNLGTIKNSNLCAEIVEYSSPDEVAVCNLSSICLPTFIKNNEFDYQELYKVVYRIAQNLDRIIDLNYYPIPEAERSNKRHRPIGIGVQGLADLFCILKLPFESKKARELNRNIFETIYFAAVSSSVDTAKRLGPYSTFKGSPASEGILQFDMWNVTPQSGLWNWDQLKKDVQQHGLRNSLLVAPMPTASTSNIMGNTECFEPYTRNFYVRKVNAGEYCIINKHLFKILEELGLWNNTIVQKIIASNGSVQFIDEIPQEVKDIFKTVYEMDRKNLIDMAVERGAYIDQSQSFNVYVEDPSFNQINKMHFYGWSMGLKTGMYYLRTGAAVDPVKVTVDPAIVEWHESMVQKKNIKANSGKRNSSIKRNVQNSGDVNQKEDNSSKTKKLKRSAQCTEDVCDFCQG